MIKTKSERKMTHSEILICSALWAVMFIQESVKEKQMAERKKYVVLFQL